MHHPGNGRFPFRNLAKMKLVVVREMCCDARRNSMSQRWRNWIFFSCRMASVRVMTKWHFFSHITRDIFFFYASELLLLDITKYPLHLTCRRRRYSVPHMQKVESIHFIFSPIDMTACRPRNRVQWNLLFHSQNCHINNTEKMKAFNIFQIICLYILFVNEYGRMPKNKSHLDLIHHTFMLRSQYCIVIIHAYEELIWRELLCWSLRELNIETVHCTIMYRMIAFVVSYNITYNRLRLVDGKLSQISISNK